MRKFTYKNIIKGVSLALLFVGNFSFVNADIQYGINGRNGGQHTGFIYCPNNEMITHFELAFDSSSSVRDNVPYDMYINGVKIYSNQTPSSVITSGFNTFATTTLVAHSPVNCYGQATWLASSTSPTGELMRILFQNINTANVTFTPNYTFSPTDRLTTLYLSTNPTDQNLIGSKTRFANSVYYLSTSTPSSGGSITFPSTTTIANQNDQLWNFTLLLIIFFLTVLGTVTMLRPLYVRK